MAQDGDSGITAENSTYKGQYAVKDGMTKSFESLWGKYGSSLGKNDSVKSAMLAFFSILDEDIRRETELQDANMPMLDRVEFRDICRTLAQILDEHVSAETETALGASVEDRKNLTDGILNLLVKFKKDVIQQFSDNELKKQLDDEGLKEKLRRPISKFMRDVARAGTRGKRGKAARENIKKFVDALNQARIDDNTVAQKLESLSQRTPKFGEIRRRIESLARPSGADRKLNGSVNSISKMSNGLLAPSTTNVSALGSACRNLWTRSQEIGRILDAALRVIPDDLSSAPMVTFASTVRTPTARAAMMANLQVHCERWLFPTIVKVIRTYGGKIFDTFVLKKGPFTNGLVTMVEWCQGIYLRYLNFKSWIENKKVIFKRKHKVLYDAIKLVGKAVNQLKAQIGAFGGWVWKGVKAALGLARSLVGRSVGAAIVFTIGSVKSIMSSMSKILFHPLDTLKKISDSGIFKMLLVAFSSNTAAYGLGMFCGFAFGLLKRLVLDKVFGGKPIDFTAIFRKTVVVPLLRAANHVVGAANLVLKVINWILKFVNENIFANAIIKSIIGLVTGRLKFATWFVGLASDVFGYNFSQATIDILGAQLPKALSMYMKVKTRPFLNAMWANGGILGKVLGASMASMMDTKSIFDVTVDDDIKKPMEFAFKDGISGINNDEFSEYKVSRNMRIALDRTDNSSQFDAADALMRSINRERFEIRDSLYVLQDLMKRGDGYIPEELAQTMLTSSIIEDAKLRKILDEISVRMFGKKFADLDGESQVRAMLIFMRSRLWVVNDILTRFQNAGDDPKKMIETIRAADDMANNLQNFIDSSASMEKISSGIANDLQPVQMNGIVSVEDMVEKVTGSNNKDIPLVQEFLGQEHIKKGFSITEEVTYTGGYLTGAYRNVGKRVNISTPEEKQRLEKEIQAFLYNKALSDGASGASRPQQAKSIRITETFPAVPRHSLIFTSDFEGDASREKQEQTHRKAEEKNSQLQQQARNVENVKGINYKIKQETEKLEQNKDTLQWINETVFPLLDSVLDSYSQISDTSGDAGGISQ